MQPEIDLDQPYALLSHGFHIEQKYALYYESVKEIKGYIVKDLDDCFQQIQAAQQQGDYVVGYFRYELGYALEPKLEDLLPDDGQPLLYFTVFRKRELLTQDQYLQWLKRANKSEQDLSLNTLFFDMTKKCYRKHIENIKKELSLGNTYQVNFTGRYQFPYESDIMNLYKNIINQQDSEYSACLSFEDNKVASVSPELFFRKRNQKITVKPMKGTTPRSKDPVEDNANQAALFTDKKIQAENRIIVDLLRNDLSKIAKPSTVRVKTLFETETHPTLHQMTSTIEAECFLHTTLKQLIYALFPCGSITGAPKVSTMRIIHQLEQTSRGVYTGAIGVIEPNNDMCFNVAIRTIELNDKMATLGVGGGITIDSNAEDEWDEMHLKAKFLTSSYAPEFQLVESLRYEKGSFNNFKQHLQRLSESADKLGFLNVSTQIFRNTVTAYAANLSNDLSYKIRIVLDYSGGLDITHGIIADEETDQSKPLRFVVSKGCVDETNMLFQYKTTSAGTRGWMDENFVMTKKMHPDIDTVIFKNSKGYLTEAVYHNLIIGLDGQLYTPPVSDGLLPGIYRQQLMDNKRVIEKSLTVDELKKADNVWLCNDVRGVQQAVMVNTIDKC